MIRHILTLFGNQKRKYSGMFLEQAVVFIVLIFCFVNTGDTVALYYTPGMLDTKNTLIFGVESKPEGRSLSSEEVKEMMGRVCETLRQQPFVETISTCSFFVPYLRSESSNPSDTLKCDGKSVKVYVKGADEYTSKVFRMEVEEGEWLSTKMLDNGTYPIVITRQLADQFGWHEVVGRTVSFDGQVYTIVGVIAGLKQEARNESCPTLILPNNVCRYSYWTEYVARIQEGEEKTFSKLLDQEFTRLFSGTNREVTLYSLEDLKAATMLSDTMDIGAMAIPTVFLLIFTFIGTFGLFWLYSTKRRKEFALRIVIGSTPGGLIRFVILESLLLTVIALLPGMVLFCWLYSFTMVHGIALGVAVIVMVLFSMFSAWWPAYKVARVNPVEAMREE